MIALKKELANYIQKAALLDAHNKKLEMDLKVLREGYIKSTDNVNGVCKVEIASSGPVLDQKEKEKEEEEKRIKTLQVEIEEVLKKIEEGINENSLEIDNLVVEHSNIEAKSNLFENRIAARERNMDCLKIGNKKCTAELTRVREEIDQEKHRKTENKGHIETLLAEINFMKHKFNAELNILQASSASKICESDKKNLSDLRKDLTNSFNEICEESEKLIRDNYNETMSWYQTKMQEINNELSCKNEEIENRKEEFTTLRGETGELRAKISDLESKNVTVEQKIKEMNDQEAENVTSFKDQLLEKDANIEKLKKECKALSGKMEILKDSQTNLKEDLDVYKRRCDEKYKANTTFKRSHKRNVFIEMLCPDGKFVILKNTHLFEKHSLANYKLKSTIDGKREIVFTFPSDFTIGPLQTVQIFARGRGIPNPPGVLVFDDEDTFGVGDNVQVTLYNKEGKERATFILSRCKQEIVIDI